MGRLDVIALSGLLALTPVASIAQPIPSAGQEGRAVAPTRQEVRSGRAILLYVVKPPSDEAQKGLDSWLQTFRNSVRFLLADSLGRPDEAPPLKVSVVTKRVDEVDADMLESSFGEQPSLQVLSTVARYASQSTFVDNDVYLGDLKGSLSGSFIFITREIQPGQYKPTREALSVITLYAYAMALAKASSPEFGRFAVCRILDRANMYRSGDLDGEVRKSLEKLFQAISTELQARECGGKR